MALAPTPENFRAEIARHMLTREAITEKIGMNPNTLSQFVSGTRPLQGWAAHNIGMGINMATGLRLIDVDTSKGVLPAPKRGRKVGWRKYPVPNTAGPLKRVRRTKPVSKSEPD